MSTEEQPSRGAEPPARPPASPATNPRGATAHAPEGTPVAPPDGMPTNGTELMALFLPQSPFVQKMGVTAEALEDDRAVLRMPWDPANVTVDDMVHGGALAAMCDIVAMATAWSGAPLPTHLRGVTTSMAIEFLAPARATDVIGTGRVLRRGRSLVNVEIDLHDGATNRIAKAIATYKVG